MNRQNILGTFIKVMAVIYLLCGIILLIIPHFSFRIGGTPFVLEGTSKLIMGFFLVVYGLYRCYLSFKRNRDEKNMTNQVLMIGFVSAFGLTSCLNNTKGVASLDNDTVNVAVDETFMPIMQSGYEVFNSLDTLSNMNMEFVAENVAIKNLLDGSAILAVASRQLTKEENAAMNQKSLYPRTTKIAIDAIALITHKSNPDSVLSVNEIRQILTGEITNWNQLGKGQKDMPIRVIFDNNESGIVRFMLDSICHTKDFKAKAFAMTFNTDVVDFVSRNEDAIGFIGASWISDPNDTLHLSFHQKIQVMAVCDGDDKENSESFKPYQAYMLGGLYPFTRDIYMINAEPNNGKATRFTNFMAGEKGQRIILKSGILPAVAPTRTIHVSNSF